MRQTRAKRRPTSSNSLTDVTWHSETQYFALFSLCHFLLLIYLYRANVTQVTPGLLAIWFLEIGLVFDNIILGSGELLTPSVLAIFSQIRFILHGCLSVGFLPLIEMYSLSTSKYTLLEAALITVVAASSLHGIWKNSTRRLIRSSSPVIRFKAEEYNAWDLLPAVGFTLGCLLVGWVRWSLIGSGVLVYGSIDVVTFRGEKRLGLSIK